MAFVELHCHSAYSFLDGASHPEELAARAAELGYEALALTDHDGVYGSLEFAHAAKAFGVRPITGAEVTLADGSHVTLLVESPRGYANLCRLLTAAHAGTRPKPTEPVPPSLDRHLFATYNEGPRLPVRLRAGRARGPQRQRSGRAGVGLRPRPVLRRAPASRTSAVTRSGTRGCASSRRRSACRPSSRETSTRTTAGARSSRTRWSRSGTGRRSKARNASGAATTSASCSLPTRWRSASPTIATPSPAPPSSPNGSSSTSPRSSATAIRTSPTAPSPRSRSWPASATAHSRPATALVTDCC